MADEVGILQRVRELVADEHELRERLQEGAIDADDERERIAHIEEELDQCWDLLRQRRARIETHQDPDEAAARPVRTVEGYLQ